MHNDDETSFHRGSTRVYSRIKHINVSLETECLLLLLLPLLQLRSDSFYSIGHQFLHLQVRHLVTQSSSLPPITLSAASSRTTPERLDAQLLC